jgi:hypothetical protein
MGRTPGGYFHLSGWFQHFNSSATDLSLPQLINSANLPAPSSSPKTKSALLAAAKHHRHHCLGPPLRSSLRSSSTLTLPTQFLTLNVSSVVRSKSGCYSVTLNTGGLAFCLVRCGLIYFDVVGRSKSPIRVANPVYRSNIAAKNTFL